MISFMPPQEVRKILHDRPFIPFTLHVSDGTHYDVESPSDVLIDVLSVTVGIDPDESGLFRRTIRIAPNHISRIEMKPDRAQQITGGAGPSAL